MLCWWNHKGNLVHFWSVATRWSTVSACKTWWTPQSWLCCWWCSCKTWSQWFLFLICQYSRWVRSILWTPAVWPTSVSVWLRLKTQTSWSSASMRCCCNLLQSTASKTAPLDSAQPTNASCKTSQSRARWAECSHWYCCHASQTPVCFHSSSRSTTGRIRSIQNALPRCGPTVVFWV